MGWLRASIIGAVIAALAALALVGCAASAPAPTLPTEAASEPPAEEGEPTESPSRTMIICSQQEPLSLIWSERSLATQAILEAVQEPLIDERGYGYQANLVEKLPAFEDGDARLEAVEITVGDRFYDVRGERTLTLTLGMTETFALAQYDSPPVEYQGWNGQNLPTVQLTAEWLLRGDLMWEDGTPVTAEDSVFTFEIERDPQWPGPRRQLIERTASYTALDERRVEWRGLPGYTDSLFFLNLFLPQPRHAYGAIGMPALLDSELPNRRPLAYGPYRLVEWLPGERIELAANEHYHHGLPPLDRLVIRFIPDSAQIIAQVASGACDIALQDAGFEAYYPTLTHLAEKGLLRVESAVGTSFEHLDFNLAPVEGYGGAAALLPDSGGGRLFVRTEFRQAVAHCIDRQALVDQVTNGAAFVPATYTAKDHPLYPGDEALRLYPFDPALGRALLESLGWRDNDSDGVADNGEGVRLSLRLGTRANGLREQVMQVLQAQLAEHCGIELMLEPMEAEFFADGPDGPLFGRRYDLAEFAWLTGVEPPCNLYISSEIPSEANAWGGNNNVGYSDAAFDAACTTALLSLDPAQKAAAHAEAMRLFSEQLPSIPLFARAKITLVRPNVIGVEPDPTANSEMWNVENFDFQR